LKEVVLYTREACSLCKTAKAVILSLKHEVDFVFREVDIDGDPELFEEHKHDIPVIEIDGKRAFKYRVDPDALRRRLEA